MSAAFKIFAGKCIAIKIALAAKTPFSFFIPVNDHRYQFYTLYCLREIYKTICIAGLNMKFQQIAFWNSDEHCIVFIKNFHTVQQYMTYKPQTILQKIIKQFIMHCFM